MSSAAETTVAAGLSLPLQMPGVARWAIADDAVPPDRVAVNSSQLVAVVHRRHDLGLDVPLAGSVLLVDDRVVNGWSATLTARALRETGTTAVLPLVLAEPVRDDRGARAGVRRGGGAGRGVADVVLHRLDGVGRPRGPRR